MPKAARILRTGKWGSTEGETRIDSEDFAMKSDTELHEAPVQLRQFPLPRCPECSDLLFAPAASEFVNRRLVRHIWSCDNCGHEFTTSVELSFRRVRGATLA
jgi:ribosomal protein L37AE/L43A